MSCQCLFEDCQCRTFAARQVFDGLARCTGIVSVVLRMLSILASSRHTTDSMLIKADVRFIATRGQTCLDTPSLAVNTSSPRLCMMPHLVMLGNLGFCQGCCHLSLDQACLRPDDFIGRSRSLRTNIDGEKPSLRGPSNNSIEGVAVQTAGTQYGLPSQERLDWMLVESIQLAVGKLSPVLLCRALIDRLILQCQPTSRHQYASFEAVAFIP